MRWLLLGVIASGCDNVFGLTSIELPDAPPCSVAFQDEFTSTIPCVSWGDAYLNGGAVTAGSGELVVQPAMASMSASGCASTASYALGNPGITVHIAGTVAGQDAYTGIEAKPSYALGIENGTINFTDDSVNTSYAKDQYDPVKMAWLRLRYDSTAVIAEYSATGAVWKVLGKVPATTPPPAGQVVLNVSLYTTPTYSGMGRFAHFLVCQ